MKNKIVALVLLVALFIPTVVAVVNYISLQGGEVSAVNVESIEFTDPDGVKSTFARDGSDEEKAMLDFFINIKNNSEKINEPPSIVNDKILCNMVAYTTAGGENAFKFYFTSNKEDCYYVDGNGDTYHINDTYALTFLNSKYAGFVFENGSAPTMTLTGGGTLTPDTSTWNFVGADGKYISAATSTKDEAEAVELEGGFDMSFSSDPDLFRVKVVNKDDGIVLFDDDYANIAGLSIESNMVVSVEATAKWYQADTRNFYGEQTYKFEATLAAPAQFYAGINKIQIGEFICITAMNVKNPQNISFSSTPAIGFTPTFYADGDYAYALIPFHNELEKGEYVLNFTYGSVSQNITVNLETRDNGFATRERTYADADIENLFNDEMIKKAEEVLLPICETGSAKRYFSGSFLEGIDANDGGISTGYGHTIEIKGTDKSFVHTGVDYAANAGTDVQATNAGEVVYAGFTDYSGYIVVIEHGYGLKSWYAHLGEISVKEGDIVAAGDKVGTCGTTGFINGAGVHVGYTVKDVVVCQYTLWADGNNKGIPVYKPE